MGVTCVFVSNYINHHQIPFCNEMYRLLRGQFLFLQTEPMEEERIRMGWNAEPDLPYLKLFYEAPEECRQIILDAKLVLFGGVEDESYIEERLAQKKPVIRLSERLYKTGQWKFISPRGLRKKYHDHTSHRKDPVYLLCSGGYVASDFSIVRAYPGKKYRWGYFTEFVPQNPEELMANKGYCTDSSGEKIPYLLWAARMIEWKHPELAIQTAEYLKSKGLRFHMDLIGDGELLEQMKTISRELKVEDCIRFLGAKGPREVRQYMDLADVFLLTSDRREGWGAVLNESMNSGCAVVADHMVGAVPFLIRHDENGLVYHTGSKKELFAAVERLVTDTAYRKRLGRNAYETIKQTWNPKNAATELLRLCLELGLLDKTLMEELPEPGPNRAADGPCSPAPVYGERQAYRRMTR